MCSVAPSSGVNTLTGAGLAEALAGERPRSDQADQPEQGERGGGETAASDSGQGSSLAAGAPAKRLVGEHHARRFDLFLGEDAGDAVFQ